MATKRSTGDRNDAPKIELYMYALNQEFPVGKGHETFLKRPARAWTAQWGVVVEGEQAAPSVPLEQLILRSEAFGGLAFDPSADRVYKLNPAGFALLTKVVDAAKNRRLESIAHELETSPETAPFIEFLRGVGLWPN